MSRTIFIGTRGTERGGHMLLLLQERGENTEANNIHMNLSYMLFLFNIFTVSILMVFYGSRCSAPLCVLKLDTVNINF